jgi:probable rRNA maturation factor
MTLTLDLAFDLSDALEPALLAQVGGLANPEQAETLWGNRLRGWLTALQAELPGALQAEGYSLGLQLVSDGEMAELNQSWRHRSGPTDVLAFAAQEGGAPVPTLQDSEAQLSPEWGAADLGDLELGDIVISLDTAAQQAMEADHSLEHEVLFLASHGLLHLLGWDHPDDASLEAMLARQERLLAR